MTALVAASLCLVSLIHALRGALYTLEGILVGQTLHNTRILRFVAPMAVEAAGARLACKQQLQRFIN